MASRIAAGTKNRPSDATLRVCGLMSPGLAEGGSAGGALLLMPDLPVLVLRVGRIGIAVLRPVARYDLPGERARRPFSRVSSSAISQTRPVLVPGAGRRHVTEAVLRLFV